MSFLAELFENVNESMDLRLWVEPVSLQSSGFLGE